MSNKKNKGGRPRTPEHLKAKPISKALRVPNIALNAVYAVIKAVKEGSVSESEIIEFIRNKERA